MPTTLVLTFPFGRYHATPWDRHVNEAAVEVPPSPWRLLRALYAVWRCRCPDLPEDVVHPMLATLATPPAFYVPAHDISHTRHYFPADTFNAQKTSTPCTLPEYLKRNLTFDAFAAFGKGAQIAARWPVELTPEGHDALRRIAGSIPYFGRADSVCSGAVDDDWEPAGHGVWKPLDVAERADTYITATSVLAPELPLAVNGLLEKPDEVRRGGLRFPAGSRFVAYGLERAADEPGVAAPARPQRAVTAVRFDLLHPALPPETDAVIYTDLLRQAAVRKQNERCGPDQGDTMLGGKTADGEYMRARGHAHYLPVVRDRRLTGLVVWTPGTVSDDELDVLCDIQALYDYKRRVQVRVSGIGAIDQIAPELVGPARTWCAVTPFTPARYPKKNRDEWRRFVVNEIQRELELRGRERADDVQFVGGPWTAFVRHRPSARMRGDKRQGQAHLPAEFLRLRFTQPTRGPLTLGWLSHFGLGLFLPEG
ncbi:Conserved CRISPR-associated protein of unknown function Csb2 [Mycobacterium canettii CIPT 140070017]|nr:Conserved CRISPR-associated protein of unknown function Csb2 [Mycobacterium canettii CIPT 140070017]